MTASKKSVEEAVPKLSEAGAVGQYVLGSSAGSRYVCVLLGKQLNLAVRITDDYTVSARVESPQGSLPNAAALDALGFTVHGDKYASAHTKAMDALHASMGVAAYIVGILSLGGTTHVMPYSDLLALPGKGA